VIVSEPEFVQTDVSSAEPEIGLVRTALLTPPKRNGNALLLLASAAAFALVALRDRSMADVLILLGVLLFHELGHLAGMKLFGYRDVRMFFIPFFGAAVSGRPMATTAWHEAVVLLLGPLPGIVIAIPALVFSIAFDSAIARDAAFMLIAINAFNLLPLAPLDGGRLFQLLLFSRQRLL
jgi:Zn-dependent protease